MVPTFRTTGHVLLEVRGVHKAYDDHVVLDGVDLQICDIRRTDRTDIQQGQIASLIGPSGIGKSTLFEILAGLQEPNKGTVMIDNPETSPVDGLTTEDLIKTMRGKVGVVYQDYRLFEFWTVETHFREALRVIGMKDRKAIKQRLDDYLSWFRLDEHRRKFPFELSGGQKQRVAIAQQLLMSPQLLLMDEPFSGLDPETKNSVMKMILDVSQKNELLTIIIISHDIISSLRVSDTVYVMGRNRDEQGVLRPGASILKDRTKSLKDLGLAWRPGDAEVNVELARLEHELNMMFPYLSGKS